jgi:hypothetical protein
VVGRELRKRIARVFVEREIPVPLPEMTVHVDGAVLGLDVAEKVKSAMKR